MPSIHVWYVRRKGEVKGPYPAGLITRYILLGRIREDDELSPDGSVWTLVQEHRELIPDVIKAAATDPAAQQRLEAARRWADERNTQRRGVAHDAEEGVTGTERRAESTGNRRSDEELHAVDHRLSRSARGLAGEKSPHQWTALAVIVAVVGTAVAALIYFYHPLPPDKAVDCNSVPAPRVNWSNCTLDGAQLNGADLANAKLYSTHMTGANLRGANLVGANLRRARLVNAHLERADLSYADLAGAELSGVALGEAKLGNAIWSDGKVCAPESVGTCVPRP